jgi:hypothetical protein
VSRRHRRLSTDRPKGNFLIWHRWYIHQYELKLNACGYNGALPYWDWGFDVNNPRASPVFDGSDTSMGSDGEFIPGPPLSLVIPGNAEPIVLAKGTGGGCVFSGPFKDMTVHLGPISQPDPTQDNPRCLKRDLNADSGRRFASFRNTTDLIVNSPNIEIFRTTMEADPNYIPNSLGVHGGGHFIISGDPGSDAFISSGDPAFYLHHAQIDRVYWIWQMLDFENRQVCRCSSHHAHVPEIDFVTGCLRHQHAPQPAAQRQHHGRGPHRPEPHRRAGQDQDAHEHGWRFAVVLRLPLSRVVFGKDSSAGCIA